MSICPLCKEREANQTGSHIFTHFLIKTAINDVGSLKRDKEIMFTLSGFHLEKSYIGRGITEDRIKEVLGKTMTDEDIEKNINSLTIDNLVCNVCEKRFTTAENYFNAEIYQKLHSKSFKTSISMDSKDNIIISLSDDEVNIDIIRLFFYIQIWRASASGYEKFKLKPDLEKRLNKIIAENLDLDYAKTIENCKENSDEIRSFPMSITFVETVVESATKKERTENAIFAYTSKIPYYFALNDIYIQFYEKSSHIRSSIEYLFGINEIIPIEEHINFKESALKIGILPDSTRRILVERFLKSISEATLHTLKSFYSYSYRAFFGKRPTIESLRIAVQKVVESDNYTLTSVTKIYSEIFLNIFRRMR